ncbi:MAG: hypothetical protein KAJ42_00810, partial [Gemmatimonadetes bacterium]|nr:hypothetical protein [Gemmatimonadota bacterium]
MKITIELDPKFSKMMSNEDVSQTLHMLLLDMTHEFLTSRGVRNPKTVDENSKDSLLHAKKRGEAYIRNKYRIFEPSEFLGRELRKQVEIAADRIFLVTELRSATFKNRITVTKE